jgi:hypothetical protein
MASPQQTLFGNVPFAFADRFLADHAGQIITEPRTAILELIANAYDAGATKITIQWPSERGDEFWVVDDGTGMTKDEFEERWKTFCYDRPLNQGTAVVFPPGVKGLQRTAFGRSGKGRFAPFCFSDSYKVVTWKNGVSIEVQVDVSAEGQTPFNVSPIKESKKSGHGTRVSANVEKHLLPVEDLCQLIGSKFLVDPSLSISVNGNTVQLLALEGLKTKVLEAPPHGSVTVHFIDSIEHYRTAQLPHGGEGRVRPFTDSGRSSVDCSPQRGTIVPGSTVAATHDAACGPGGPNEGEARRTARRRQGSEGGPS